METIIDDRNFGYFRMFNGVLDPDMELSEIDFFIYSKICRHAGNKPTAYFSLAKLKNHMKWGNSTVSATIRKLQNVGLIEAKRKQKGYEFRLIGSVADFLGSPTGKSLAKTSSQGKAELPHGERRLPQGGNKEDSYKKTIKEEKNGATAPINGSHLVKAYMDKQLEDEIVEKVEDARPSDAERGMLRNLAKRGVTPSELKNLIDVGWDEKKYSIDHISRDLATLRAKVAEIKPARTKTKTKQYKSKCPKCGNEENHSEPIAQWCNKCWKRMKLIDIETGNVIPRN